MRFLLCAVFLFINLSFVFSQERRSIAIKKIDDGKIKVDGTLDEPEWLSSDSACQFYQMFPYDTSLASTKTQAFVVYDNEYLYISAICYDMLAGDYVIQSLRRDFSYPVSDAFVVSIDPFDDKTTGFSFGVNPYGVQREGLIASGGGMGVSTDWDNKWKSEVQRYTDKWTVEMAIPFKTLRYKEGNNKWGINFSRNDLKRNESSNWSRVPRNFNNSSLAFTGELLWDTPPPKPGTNVSIIPYVITGNSIDYISDGKLKRNYNIGLDAKVAVTPSLNLDLTVNPDFAQVDVDRQITNLTRFSIFYPERRNFFLENSDLFASFGFSRIRPFFSRNIGLRNGQAVPILGGARLSGRINKNWRIGLMNIQEGENENTQFLGGTILADFNKATTNYTVAAVQRQVFARSNIAAILVNKQDLHNSNKFNRIVGLDYNLASADNKWHGKAFYHMSLSPTKNTNNYAHASWLMYNAEKIYVEWNHEYVGQNYNAETGFVPRIYFTDDSLKTVVRQSYWRLEPHIDLRFYPKSTLVNMHGPGLDFDEYYNRRFEGNDRKIGFNYFVNFQNTSSLVVEENHFFTRLYYYTDVLQKNVLFAPGDYKYRSAKITYTSNKRRVLTGLASIERGSFFDGNKTSYHIEGALRIQPKAIFSIYYTRDNIEIEKLNTSNVLNLIGPKIDYSFTRNIFVTTFVQYNSQINNLNINARFQWRFHPMSDFFIVYTDNYHSYNTPNSIYFTKKNRALVFKFVYWFSV